MSILGKVKSVINALLRRGYWYDNVFLPDTRKFVVYNTFNTKVVNLGSTSSVAAFDYSGLNIKAANWALSRNPLAGDWAILRNYSSYLDSKGSIVIVPLCPFSTLAGSYEPFDDRYYSILYPSTIPSYSYVHNVQAQDKIKNPVRYYPWNGLFVDLWHSFIRVRENSLSEEKMEEDAQNRVNGWLHEFALSSFNSQLTLWNKDNIKEALQIIANIIYFCIEHNATPVIVVPPVYKSMSKRIPADARTTLLGDVQRMARDMGVSFYNYMDDAQFNDERLLFKDSFILNKKGAKEFTKRVLTDLNII